MRTNYTISDIAKITNGRLLSSQPSNLPVRFLLTDSRRSFPSVGAMFIALVGKNHNGNHYIQQCYEKGVRFFLVSEAPDRDTLKDVHIILVENTLTALQALTAHHRNQFDIPVIGVTGSNGKTIVKEWLSQLLAVDYKVVKSPKSYNSQIGVPLSVWQISEGDELGIFEAGISTTEEMKQLVPIIHCDICLITNIGEAHSEGFSSIEEKVIEKLKLAKHASLIVYCMDYPEIHKAVQRLYPEKNTYTWSYKQKADLQITKIEQAHKSTILTAVFPGKERDSIGSSYKIQLPFQGEAYIENSVHCWCLLDCFNVPFEEISKRMQLLRSLPLRLELLEGVNNCTIINDGYNNDLNSLEIALDFLLEQTHHEKTVVILSDILQSGLTDQALYSRVADLVNGMEVSELIGIGPAIPNVKPHLISSISFREYPTTKAFLSDKEYLKTLNNSSVLLKGARTFKFEDIANVLIQKKHKTVLEINLSAVSHNLNVYRNLLEPGTKLMAMVKASGYGSGSLEIARLLEFQQIDYLAVAYTDEGVELRKAGIQLPIMVMNPEPSSLGTLVRYQLEPQVYSFSLLQQLIALEKEAPIPVHIMLDTGMKRLGFEPKDCVQLSDVLLNYTDEICLVSVFSHLASSDNPAHDSFTKEQLASFQHFTRQLSEELDVQPIRHMLNTSGISRFPEAQFEMVRLGIGLYGVDGNPKIQERLQTVCTLKATISQIKEVETGVSVGYNRVGEVKRMSRIGTISIGYADGFFRRLSDGLGQVWVHGQLAPVIGNVCMDMTMLDLTDIPEAQEGDTVEVFGANLPIADFAKAAGTIAYEGLTAVSARVKRVYFRD